ncbi:MAG: hypothetical protein AABW41_04120 [Nanoarchaeota archaeon]
MTRAGLAAAAQTILVLAIQLARMVIVPQLVHAHLVIIGIVTLNQNVKVRTRNGVKVLLALLAGAPHLLQHALQQLAMQQITGTATQTQHALHLEEDGAVAVIIVCPLHQHALALDLAPRVLQYALLFALHKHNVTA